MYNNNSNFSGSAVNFVGGAATPWSFYGWLDNTANGNVAYIQYRGDWAYNGSAAVNDQFGEVIFTFNPGLYFGKQVHFIVDGYDKGFRPPYQDYNATWAAFYIPSDNPNNPNDNVVLVMKPTTPHAQQTLVWRKVVSLNAYDDGQGNSGATVSFPYALRQNTSICAYSGTRLACNHVTIGMEMYVGTKAGVCGAYGYCIY